MSEGERKPFRWVVAIVLIGFFAIMMADALGLFKSAPYTAFPHGGHSHYVPDDLDPGIDSGQCPTRAPGPDEFISPQCQLIRMVRDGGLVYYVPDSAPPDVSPAIFPTQRPGSGQVIQPDGQLVQVTVQEGL